MGIPGLWKMLEKNGKNTSLIDLSVSEGPGTCPLGRADVRRYRVGVDVSVWFYQANAHNRQTKNAALASLFKRAAALFSLTTVDAIFVCDGSGRPNVKRKTSVRSNSHFLKSDFKSLIQSFGWQFVEAPGEAEAELAWMCADGIIDAVLTEDSDTFVFGAPRVIRIREISDHVFDITIFEDIGLSREQLVFIAVLAGGDYSDGIPGCGVKTARRLALAGFGDDLIQAALDLSSAKFSEFALTWRRRFRTALSSQSYSRNLAKKIPIGFPDCNVLHLYLYPLVSQDAVPSLVVRWDSAPRLGELAAFAAKNLSWGLDSARLFRHFKQAVFPGLAIRELIKSIASVDGTLDVDICPYSVIVDAQPLSNQTATRRSQICLSLQISPPLLQEIEDEASSAGMQGSFGSATRFLRAWVPAGLYNLSQAGVQLNLEDDDADNVTGDTIQVEAIMAAEIEDEVVVAEMEEEVEAMAPVQERRPPATDTISLLSDEDETEEIQIVHHAPIEVIDISDDELDEDKMEEIQTGCSASVEVIDISDDEL